MPWPDALAFDATQVLHLIGSKRAFPVVACVTLTLLQHGFRTLPIHDIGSSDTDQVSVLCPGDLVVTVSFSPDNSATPDLPRPT